MSKPLRTKIITSNSNVYYSEYSIKGIERAIEKHGLIPIYDSEAYTNFGYLNSGTPFQFESLDAS